MPTINTKRRLIVSGNVIGEVLEVKYNNFISSIIVVKDSLGLVLETIYTHPDHIRIPRSGKKDIIIDDNGCLNPRIGEKVYAYIK